MLTFSLNSNPCYDFIKISVILLFLFSQPASTVVFNSQTIISIFVQIKTFFANKLRFLNSSSLPPVQIFWNPAPWRSYKRAHRKMWQVMWYVVFTCVKFISDIKSDQQLLMRLICVHSVTDLKPQSKTKLAPGNRTIF